MGFIYNTVLCVRQNLSENKKKFTFIGQQIRPLTFCVNKYFEREDPEYRNPDSIIVDDLFSNP